MKTGLNNSEWNILKFLSNNLNFITNIGVLYLIADISKMCYDKF